VDGFVITMYVFGKLSKFTAKSPHDLSRKLHRRCPFWTVPSCDRVAAELWRGIVVTVPDAEAVFLRGTFDVEACTMSDDPRYVPSWAR
jgi:hypothetical protein